MSDARHKNAFDALRLAAAILVIYSHAYLSGREQGHMFHNLGYEDIGTVAVSVFFAISGYLVTQSWLADPSLPRFFAKRCLRIFPALIAVVVFSALVVGPLLTTLPLSDYFSHSETWSYLQNILLYPRQDLLPGVFTKNPASAVVNGPIWSLPYEFSCYLFVALCGTLGIYQHKLGNMAVILTLIVGAAVYSFIVGLDQVEAIAPLRNMRHVEAFLVGSLLATQDYKALPRLFLYPCLLVLASLLMVMTKMTYVFPVVIAVASIVAARSFTVTIKDDYSYGLYLWGYVIEQTLAAKCTFLEEWPYIGLSLCLAFLPAMLSWHLIEKKALSLKPQS